MDIDKDAEEPQLVRMLWGRRQFLIVRALSLGSSKTCEMKLEGKDDVIELRSLILATTSYSCTAAGAGEGGAEFEDDEEDVVSWSSGFFLGEEGRDDEEDEEEDDRGDESGVVFLSSFSVLSSSLWSWEIHRISRHSRRGTFSSRYLQDKVGIVMEEREDEEEDEEDDNDEEKDDEELWAHEDDEELGAELFLRGKERLSLKGSGLEGEEGEGRERN